MRIMTQSEILEILEKNKVEKFTIKKLKKRLNKTRSTINTNIIKLIKWNLINYEFKLIKEENKYLKTYEIWAK